MSDYPGALDSFTEKIANFDEVKADDINELQNAIEAIEGELGTDPAGAEATVAARIAALEGASGAPADAQYVTLAANADLSNERVLTAGNGVSITDGGAGNAVTVAAKGGGKAALNVVIGDGVNISTGVKGFVEIPFACQITAVRLVADASGSIVVDIWKDSYANFPPTVADTITASAKPTLDSAQKAEDTTLTGWTKSLAAGDWLGFNVDSATTVKQVTLSLTLVRL